MGIAVALAFDDAQTLGRLRPTTRQALDHMWQAQKGGDGPYQGTWDCGCGHFPLVELDRYYVATLAAVAAGVAPDGYAQSPQARDGLTRLRRYFIAIRPRSALQLAMRLWASRYLDGVMTTDEQQAAVQLLLDRQRPDGGWALTNLERGGRRRADGGWALTSPEDAATSPSDGAGTAFVVYILRQAGVPANRPALVRGVHWLQSNQRASGGWFTPTGDAGVPSEFLPGSHGTRELALLNTTASFAVMALHACAETEAPRLRPPFERLPGLAFRARLTD